ncbi:MAG: hypothetical protein K6F66_04495 [Pseudobutyrivibrio sp.]|nr:hypothetical protein [Pseudobutyrivibrio sp.]
MLDAMHKAKIDMADSIDVINVGDYVGSSTKSEIEYAIAHGKEVIRSDYLTKTQGMIENALKNAEYAINTSGSAVDRAQATKKRDKYIKQLAEIRAYYPALSHIAL